MGPDAGYGREPGVSTLTAIGVELSRDRRLCAVSLATLEDRKTPRVDIREYTSPDDATLQVIRLARYEPACVGCFLDTAASGEMIDDLKATGGVYVRELTTAQADLALKQLVKAVRGIPPRVRLGQHPGLEDARRDAKWTRGQTRRLDLLSSGADQACLRADAFAFYGASHQVLPWAGHEGDGQGADIRDPRPGDERMSDRDRFLLSLGFRTHP
jgi:hypothetical protein